jgi:hypothetical protein
MMMTQMMQQQALAQQATNQQNAMMMGMSVFAGSD